MRLFRNRAAQGYAADIIVQFMKVNIDILVFFLHGMLWYNVFVAGSFTAAGG
ncbi:MAG: hypothetical protein Q4E34_01425 [Synergistaceae bacterium]|nr:hypothetical protein [Synergistaceae bacterium]